MGLSIDELLTVEASLDRSFGVAIVAFLVQAGWPFLATLLGAGNQVWVGMTFLVLWGLFLIAYVWFAYAAAAAARCVGRSRLLVGTWIVVAPFLALLPIPFLSLVIGASPLSIKFILSGELRSSSTEPLPSCCWEGPWTWACRPTR